MYRATTYQHISDFSASPPRQARLRTIHHNQWPRRHRLCGNHKRLACEPLESRRVLSLAAPLEEIGKFHESDVPRIAAEIGYADFEVLDTWTETRRTSGGQAKFRMYKISTGDYFGVNGWDGSLHDSQGLAALTTAARESVLPIDKLTPVLREASADWCETRLVTVQLVMPEDVRRVVQSAFGAEENEQDPELDSVAVNGLAADVTKIEENTEEQLRLRRDALAVQEQAHAGVIDQFITRQELRNEDIAYRYRYAPAIAVHATWEETLKLATDPNVVAIYHESQFHDENERSVAAARTRCAWARGFDGSGAVIAHVEDTRMETHNPYLSATVRPGTYAADDHATAVGGIICSTHSFFRGHAYGANLLSAAAGSYGQTDIVAATDWAVAQGAMVVNCSFGLNFSADFTWCDVFFDYLSANSRVLVVKSAGNRGHSDGNVTSPGKGFNVLTVGNIDGGTSPSWSGDAMHRSSSYVDSESGGEKPEVAMYGTDIYTTCQHSPFVGEMGYGTSYAAPAVSAFAGLMIDRTSAFADEPWTLKAKAMASAVAHNIEGSARLSEYDGAGAAMGTAVNAGGAAQTLSPSSFDNSGEWEFPVDITLWGGETNRIVLAYPHLPTSRFPLTPGPEDYDKSDLDLRLYVGGTMVASSAYGWQNGFEIIDYTPSATQTGRIRVSNYEWDPDISSLRIGIAYGSSSTFGSSAYPMDDDSYEDNDSFSTSASIASGTHFGLRLSDDDWYAVSVPGSSRVTVATSFDHEIGDLSLSLYESSENLVASSGGTGDLETVAYANPSSCTRTYYTRLFGYQDARNTYRMQISISLLGDFNDDGAYTSDDIDELTTEIAAGTHNVAFDMTADSLVNLADRDVWLAMAGEFNLGPGKPYLLGDASLDGVVDLSDYNIWSANNFTFVAAWGRGDFNADGCVDVSDFHIWNTHKFTSSDVAVTVVMDVAQPRAFALRLESGRQAVTDRLPAAFESTGLAATGGDALPWARAWEHPETRARRHAGQHEIRESCHDAWDDAATEVFAHLARERNWLR